MCSASNNSIMFGIQRVTFTLTWLREFQRHKYNKIKVNQATKESCVELVELEQLVVGGSNRKVIQRADSNIKDTNIHIRTTSRLYYKTFRNAVKQVGSTITA